MEFGNINQESQSNKSSSSIKSSLNPIPNKKSNLLILTIVILLIFTAGVGGYYLGTQRNNANQTSRQNVTSVTPSNSPTNNQLSTSNKVQTATLSSMLTTDLDVKTTYKDQLLGYSITIPKVGYCFPAFTCVGKTYKFGDKYIDVGVSRYNNPSGLNAVDYVSQMLNRKQPENRNTSYLEQGLKITTQSISVDSINAEAVWGMPAGFIQENLQVYVPKNQYMYMIMFGSWGKNLDDNYKDILSSFKFSN